MPETSISERRRFDQHLHEENQQLGAALKESNQKLDGLTVLVNTIHTSVAVFIAESKGTNHGVEERIRRLEDWQGTFSRYFIGIIIMVGMALFYAIANGSGIHLK